MAYYKYLNPGTQLPVDHRVREYREMKFPSIRTNFRARLGSAIHKLCYTFKLGEKPARYHCARLP